MTQNQLNREVAQATGESVDYIRNRGFSMVMVPTFIPPRCAGAQAAVKQSKRVSQAVQPLRKAA